MPMEAFRTYRILSLLYAGTFAFMAGLLSVILLDKGLDFSGIALYFAFYHLAALVLEVPTGAFADAYGRKKAILVAFLLHSVFLTGFVLLPGGLLFTAFAFLVAAGDAFMSGSAEAYAMDILYKRGKMDYTHKLLASAKTWHFTMFLVGSLIGGFAARFSLAYAPFLCLLFAVAGLAYSHFYLEDDRKKGDFEKAERSIMSKTRQSLAESVTNRSIRTVYLLTLLLGLGSFGLFMYWQPVMQSLAGWDTFMLGLFFSLISIALIIGSRTSSYIKATWGSASVVLLFTGVALALASWTPIPLAVAGLILVWEVLYGIYQPLESAIINRNIASHIRATVISLNNLSFRVGALVISGVVAIFGVAEPRSLWLVGAGFFLIAALFAATAHRKKLSAGT